MCQDVPRCAKTVSSEKTSFTHVARRGKTWQDVARRGKTWQDVARRGKTWQDVARRFYTLSARKHTFQQHTLSI
jgi:hypothetical protein